MNIASAATQVMDIAQTPHDVRRKPPNRKDHDLRLEY
jgi:hypothetical protein